MNENNNDIELKTSSDVEKSNKRKRGSDIWALIMCLVVAVFLWGYVMSMESPTSERVFNGVKVSISNMERLNEKNNLSIVSENIDLVVDVILQGKKSVLSKLTSDDIKAYIDVGNITESGTQSLDIKYLPFPDGTTFAGASSGAISLKFDSKTSIKVPVVVKCDNCIVPNGYSIGDYVLNVDSIGVQGAKSDLDKIREAVITISGKTLTSSLTVIDAVPIICDKNGKEIKSDYISYERVYVDVKIPVYLQKDIDLGYELVYGLYNSDTVDVSISPSKLTVFGEASVIEKLPDKYNVVKIDEKLALDSFKIEIKEELFGKDVSVMSDEEEIEFSIVHKKTSTTQLNFSPELIKVNNPHQLDFHLMDELKVTFRCATDKLAYVDHTNIIVVVDLSSVGAVGNSTEVAVNFNYSDALAGNIYELGSYTIKVSFDDNNAA